MIEWLIKNKEWVFSGIGVFVIGFIISKRQGGTTIRQKQKAGKSSHNIQVAGDHNVIHSSKKDNEYVE